MHSVIRSLANRYLNPHIEREGGTGGKEGAGAGQAGCPICVGDQVMHRNEKSHNHGMSIQAGAQRHSSGGLPCDPTSRVRLLVAHGVPWENPFVKLPRACCELRDLVEKSEGSSASMSKRLMAQGDESACTRAQSSEALQ